MEGLSFLEPFNEGCRGLSICKNLQPLPAMLKAVYTGHEILDVPPGLGAHLHLIWR